jgi:hypothetical protein
MAAGQAPHPSDSAVKVKHTAVARPAVEVIDVLCHQ